MPSTMPSACRAGRSTRPRRGSAASLRDSFPEDLRRAGEGGGAHLLRPFRRPSSGAAAGNAGRGRTAARPCRLRPAISASSATSGAASCGWRPSIWAGPAISAGWSGPPTRPRTSRPSRRWIWRWRAAGSLAEPDVWFVGDTDIDMNCAVNAGCLPVLLRREPRAAGEFDAYPPALHLRDCAGLAARLHALGVLPSPNYMIGNFVLPIAPRST